MTSHRLVAGLPHATALAWEIQKWTAGATQPRFLLVPDNVWAFNLRDDLAVLSPATPVFVFPALETNLLRNRGPSLARRAERLACLAELARPGGPRPGVFVVTAEALTQQCPGPELFSHSISLRKGDPLSRPELAEGLAGIGYVPAELVESPAEFAVRGSIVDIFPPGLEFPIRVELFDDVVQSVRTFHPESQRRLAEIDEMLIPPCREFLFPSESGALQELRRSLRTRLDEWDWPRAERDALLSRIDQKSFFPTIDYWAPLLSSALFGRPTAEVLFAPEVSLGIVEPGTVDTEARGLAAAGRKGLETGIVDGDWVPQPDTFLEVSADIGADLRTLFDRAERAFSLRQLPGFGFSSDEKSFSPIRGHELLASRLQADRDPQKSEFGLKALADQLREWNGAGTRTLLLAPTPSQLERLQFLLAEYSIRFPIHASVPEALASGTPLAGVIGSVQQGFHDPRARVAVLLDEEIFGARKKRQPVAKRDSSAQAREVFSADFGLLNLQVGDHVVHAEHGIGRYLGMRVLPFNGVPAELIEIEYKDGAKLLVPVTRLNVLHRHSGGGEDNQLDKLGGNTWEAKKAKVRRDLRNLAGELLHLYSKRELAKGPEIRPDKRLVDEFAASFAFVETPDQTLAIEACLKDLRGPRPMDRLICGDVGYGKTEVALRAAHAALAAGHQVAVLVPTTILAAQHENTFRKRLGAFGFRVEGLSRFKSPKEVRATLEKLVTGEVQVIVGTHKLLSSEVQFQSLGLLIVDEEQRFGVAHKERIKKLRADVHVLTLTATPIPRTLNMALSGLKEISVISTPPQNRLSVRTHIAKRKPELIRDAIQTEIRRGGQVFFLHNRIQTMPKQLEELQNLVPGVVIESVHGQMLESQIEERMLNFYEGKTQVLLTTAIIESGLDIPNANTLIVDRADAFGLAHLYQIRGRVGRAAQRAYAYFLVPADVNITADAEERLAVLESYQDLGSGFHIASHDLDLRGSGDVLGGSQSGHIVSIGIDAYLELLQEAVAESRGEPIEHEIEPEITLGIDTTIPESYIPEIGLRLLFYRNLAAARSEEEIDRIEAEMEDRFGSITSGIRGLLTLMRIRCQLSRLRVRSLKVGKSGCALVFDSTTPVNPEKVVTSVNRYPTLFLLSPDGKLVIKKPSEAVSPDELMRSVEGALALLESWCG
jgi:transcription-repair coupling factor (superfamily II helicase)